MESDEQPIFVYDTLAPLGNQSTDSSHSRPPSPLIVLDEAVDKSPIKTLKVRKIRKSAKRSESVVKICEPEVEEEEELRFLSKTGVCTSIPSPEQVFTVFRREIGDTEDPLLKESSEGEVEFLSLEVQGSNSPELADTDVITPVAVVKPEEEKVTAAVREFPWTYGSKKIKSPLLLLHQEIIDFCNFLAPTPEEQAARTAAIGRVSEVVKYIWPKCQVKVFGSFETGLYLPSSDIDVVILNSNVQVPQNGLKALAKALSKRSIATKIQVIGTARVPIIKFIENKSNVAFDVSFDVQNGPEAALFIKDAITKIPPLRPLCLILKIFLQQRELNEVYSGGIGSYALLVMLITHLQVHRSREAFTSRSTLLESNLGILLIDFFDLYGRKLNAFDVGVSCRAGGHFFSKSLKGFHNSKRPHLLSVEDPQTPKNDIGKNSFNITKVRAAFAMAHRQLTAIHIDDSISSNCSILGRIIRVDSKLLERKVMHMKVPIVENQGNLSNRWHLCEDDPFPRGGQLSKDVHANSSARKQLKRKRNEEKVHNKNEFKPYEKKGKKKKHVQAYSSNVSSKTHPSNKVEKQQNLSAKWHSNSQNPKKRKQVSEDEAQCATRHGPRWRKSGNSYKNIKSKHSNSDFNNNHGARSTNSPAQKKIKN